jgi:hypothetical protein
MKAPLAPEDEAVVRAAFEAYFKRGGYQYSQDNKDNAYAWFRAGWRAMADHTLKQMDQAFK